MSESNRERQYEADKRTVEEVVREYQHAEGHAEITVKIQHGFVTLVEDTQKRKPPKAE